MLLQALSATVAWVRLERAMAAFELDLKKHFGITGLQLSVLRICAERPQLPLAALRRALVMHPATLGQSIDELRRMELVKVSRDERDGRARNVALTDKGRELVALAPLAGPSRLRETEADPERLDALKEAFEDAIELFGLANHAPDRPAPTARK